MTIAVGFRCIDGIVLAADSQYTEGVTKLYGQKIFPIASNGYYALTIAGAGGVPSLKGAVREIEKTLTNEIGDAPATVHDIRGAIEDSLARYYPKYIDSAPKRKQVDLDFQLLVAVWTQKAMRLFETWRTNATEVDGHRCIGVGSHLAEFVTDLFFPPGITPAVDTTEPLAAYIVAKAKKYVEFCGGATAIRTILGHGEDKRVWPQEIRESELYFDKFFGALSHIRALLRDVDSVADIDMQPLCQILGEQMIELRDKRQECREKQESMRQKLYRFSP